jgi:hypothetical protein
MAIVGEGYDAIYIDASDIHGDSESINPINPTEYLDPSLSDANLTRKPIIREILVRRN